MSTKSFVFMGDLHLRPQTWQSHTGIRDDAYHALQQITDYCLKHQRNLVLGGDIHNTTRPDARSVQELRQCADALHNAGLHVFAIQGQHDYAVPSWTSAASAHMSHVDKATFSPCEGVVAYGLDNMREADVVKEAVKAIPKEASMLICHQMFREVFNMEGVWNIETPWLPKHVKHVLVGDFHEPVDFVGANDVKVLYSGSMYLCKLDETPQKSFCDVSVTDDGELQVQRIPLKSRRFVFINIKKEEDLKAVEMLKDLSLDGFDEELTPVVVVNYMATVPNVAATLTPLCEDKIMWLRPMTIRIVEDVKSDVATTHKTMSDCLPLFKQSVDPATYALLSELLTDDDTTAVIARHKAKIIPEVK